MCKSFNIDYEFYHIGENFEPIFSATLGEYEYLYIVNYFGQITNERICQYKKIYNNIIVDNVQAFFQNPVENIDTIYSCRKFFGVSDGGFLSTNTFIDDKLPIDKSKDRFEFLLGRFEETASEYYRAFSDGEEKFYKFSLCEMSPITKNILSAIDYDHVKKKREQNYTYLDRFLGEYNGLNFRIPDGSYCYPFFVENRPQIRKELATKKIFIPTLWPNVLDEPNSSEFEKNMVSNILPIPCDQRYDTEDMKTIVESLKSYIL